MHNFVLKGNICYSKGKNEIITFEDAYLVCKDNKCAGVFNTLPEEYKSFELRDYTGKIIIPGMVDLHIHAPQFAFRGLGMDAELMDWLDTETFPEESKYADIDYAKKAYKIFADKLRNSATTRASIFATLHNEATKVLMDYMEESGLISFVGKVNMDRNSPGNLVEESAEVSVNNTKAWLEATNKKYKRTFPILTPRFVPSCSDTLMKMLCDVRREYELPVQSHLSENPEEISFVKELAPKAKFYGDAYDVYHLFGDEAKTIMAHCVFSTDEEVALIKKNGVFVAHCPASNLNLSSGIAPIKSYLDIDINVGLGSDVAGGHTESIFRAITDAIQVSKMRWRYIDKSKGAVTFEEAFYMATIGGGKFFGKVGSFEEDYEFDAVVLDDSTLLHPQELSIRQRLERLVYLQLDLNGIVGKYVNGRKISLD